MKRKSCIDFIKEAHTRFGSRYDYSEVVYVDNHTNVCIICKKHGKFWQNPKSHLKGHECLKCSIERRIKMSSYTLVKRFVKINGNKYDYSNVSYSGLNKKVSIICRIHGEFLQSPYNHLRGQGCPKCANLLHGSTRKKTIDQFVGRANEVHDHKYDYSNVVYTNNATKVCIVCSSHGEFWQSPNAHLSGHGCPLCSRLSIKEKNSMSVEDFIKRANKAHGEGTYDYSKVVYHGSQSKVCIVCPIHGEFWQTPNSHIYNHGCKKCMCNIPTTEECVSNFTKVWGTVYDYSEVAYSDNMTKVKIICPIHGEFWQEPCSHMHGHGCRKCGDILKGQYIKKPLEEFIKEANDLHKDEYDYTKVVYINSKTDVCIICRKCKYEFFMTPTSHLAGSGCSCRTRSRGELFIKKWLIDNNAYFIREYKYQDLRGLGNCPLKFDFYIPSINLLIEYDGEQHFRSARFNGMSEEQAIRNLSVTKYNDNLKNKYCINNGIPLLRITYKDFKHISEILSNNILRCCQAA